MTQHAGDPESDPLLIVVGAHPGAERNDRAAAYMLQEQINRAFLQIPRESSTARPDVLVCTDLWYLNDDGMRRSAAISLGAPGVNACSAYLASRLPSAFAIDDVLIVQIDLTSTPPLAACWGTTPARSAQAVGIFVERYLVDFLDAAMPQ